MDVETFECQETMTEPIEASEEAIRLMEDMELSGQLSLVKPPTAEERGTRCPYRKIRADEIFVYRRLCPQETELSRFSECPIPLRVLQIAAHAKGLEMFKEFWVWSAQGQVKDPVLVAYTTDRYHGGDCFILARWGDVLEAWPKLVEKAMSLWRDAVRSVVATHKVQMNMDEARIDSLSFQEAVQHSDGPHYYGF